MAVCNSDVHLLTSLLDTGHGAPRGTGSWSASVIGFFTERLAAIDTTEALQHMLTLAGMVVKHQQDHPCGEWRTFAAENLLPLLLQHVSDNIINSHKEVKAD